MRLSRRARMGICGASLALSVTVGSAITTYAEPATPSPTPSPSASASPSTAATSTTITTPAQARAELIRLRGEQQKIEGKAAEIEKRLGDTSDRIDEKSGDIQARETKIKAAKKKLAAVAVDQYQNRETSTTAQLFLSSGDTQDFLDSLSAADNVASNNTSLLNEYNKQVAQLTDDRRALNADKALANKDFKELQQLRNDAKKKVDEAQALYTKLDETTRQQFFDQGKLRQDSTSRSTAMDESGPNSGGEPSRDINKYPAPKVTYSGFNGYAFGNCTAYAFARRAQLGRPIPNGWHHAKQWPSGARAAGFAVDSTPEVGAVYVTFRGPYGHVMVVEKILDGGSFLVSEMNYHGGPGTGFNRISTRVIPSVGGVFIH